MKFIFRILLVLFLSVLAAIIALFFIVLKPAETKPHYLENLNPVFRANEVVQLMLINYLLEGEGIVVSEKLATELLHQKTDGFKGEEFQFNGPANTTIKLQTAWLEFNQEHAEIKGIVNVLKKETTFALKLKISDYDGKTEVRIHELKIGALRLSGKMLSKALNAMKVQDLFQLNQHLEFNLSNLTLQINDQYFNDFIKDETNIEMISFSGLSLLDQQMVFNITFTGTEGAIYQVLLKELKPVLTDHDAFISDFTANLNEHALNSATITAISEQVATVLEQLGSKLNTGTLTELTENDQKVLADLSQLMLELEDQEQTLVVDAFVNTLIEQVAKTGTETDQALLADYLGIEVSELGAKTVDHERLNELWMYFFK